MTHRIINFLFILLHIFSWYIVLCGSQVQAVAWNHYAPEVLLSGSFDQTVVLVTFFIPFFPLSFTESYH